MAKKRETCPRGILRDLYARAEGSCEVCGTNVRGIGEIHHLNRKPKDNRLANLKLLCPTHHARAHKDDKRGGKKRGEWWFNPITGKKERRKSLFGIRGI